MSDLEQQISDLYVDGKITEGDAETVLAFREFLDDTPAGLTQARGEGWEAMFEGREMTYATWRMKWLPYMCGLAQGPSTPEEWPAYREQIKAMR